MHMFYTYMYMYMYVHVLMRDEKEERSKQGQTNNKAKQHSTPKAVTVHHIVFKPYLFKDKFIFILQRHYLTPLLQRQGDFIGGELEILNR